MTLNQKKKKKLIKIKKIVEFYVKKKEKLYRFNANQLGKQK